MKKKHIMINEKCEKFTKENVDSKIAKYSSTKYKPSKSNIILDNKNPSLSSVTQNFDRNAKNGKNIININKNECSSYSIYNKMMTEPKRLLNKKAIQSKIILQKSSTATPSEYVKIN